MVSDLVDRMSVELSLVLLAQAPAEGPVSRWEALAPIDQLRVIMGIFVVVVLGIFIFIVIKAGSHMVKGFSAPANRLRSDSLPKEDDWAQKPLNELPDDVDGE